ncbi:hypothetical protein [Micromonospora haikouensis]|uniref:hypothetical protein n=1 Tax=Micromonospora haikouensis TaxID=686309 RepID=UPI000A4FD8F7|nr:hypothetical protein [Micromonospora haikouensis]
MAEFALSAAVVPGGLARRSTPRLRAAADLTDITEATGLDVNEVVQRWRRWIDVQTRLDIGGRPAVDPAEVRAIEQRLGPGVIP